MDLSKEYLDAIKKDEAKEVIELLQKAQFEMGIFPRKMCEEAFLYASQHGKVNTIKSLVKDMKVDINVVDDNSRSALDKLGRIGDFETMKFLLDNGANVSKYLVSDKSAKLNEEQMDYLREIRMRQLKEKGPQIDFLVLDHYNENVDFVRVTFPNFMRGDDTCVTFSFESSGRLAAEQYLDLKASINRNEVGRCNIVRSKDRDDVADAAQKGIIPHLRKAKFNDDANSEIIEKAQKVALKKWSDYEKKLQEKRAQTSEESGVKKELNNSKLTKYPSGSLWVARLANQSKLLFNRLLGRDGRK